MNRILSGRAAALGLAFLILFSLAACRSTERGTEGSTPAELISGGDPATGPVSAEPVTAEPEPYLDAVTFEDPEFLILASVSDAEGGRHFSEFEGSLTGNNLDAAIYHRDEAIQEKYQVVFNIRTTKNWNTELRAASLTGDTYFHIATPGISNAVFSVSEGFVANLDLYPHFDFSKLWWNAQAMEQMSVLGRHLFAISDINLLAFDSVGVIFFNKGMATEYLDVDLFDLVRDGAWTYEKMMKLASDVTFDYSGDGVIGTGDVYGIAGGSYSALCFTFGGNYSFVVKDADGVPGLRDDYTDFFNFFQKVVSDHADPNVVGYGLSDGAAMFGENRQLFRVEMLGASLDLRAAGVSYGILPLPKWNEAQTDFYTFPHQSASTTICIPTANKEYDKTSRIVEDLAHYSRDHVLTHYIQGNLYLKNLDGDTDSYEIVLNLLQHLNCDIFFSYRAGITDVLRTSMDNHDTNIASKFVKYDAPFRNQLSKIVAGLMESE